MPGICVSIMDNTTAVQYLAHQGASNPLCHMETKDAILSKAHSLLISVTAKSLKGIYIKWVDVLSHYSSLQSEASVWSNATTRPFYNKNGCTNTGFHLFCDIHSGLWYRCPKCRWEPMGLDLSPSTNKKFLFLSSSEVWSFQGFSNPGSPTLEGPTLVSPAVQTMSTTNPSASLSRRALASLDKS